MESDQATLGRGMSWRSRRRSTILVVLLHLLAAGSAGSPVALLLPSLASAQPSEADRATARRLAEEGYRALQKGDYTTAEDRFRRADALVHAPSLVVDHARALVGLGRLVEAHERYELVLREGVAPGSPAAWHRALADAEQELEALKPRLAWLTIRLKTPREAVVQVDDRPVPPAALGVRRAVDPGTRTVSASAPGYQQKEVMVTLAEGEEQELELELEPIPKPRPAPLPARRKEKPPPRAPSARSDRKLAYLALGAGAAGLVAGSITGWLALRDYRTLEDRCPDRRCPPTERDAVSRYHALGIASGVAFGVGAAGAVLGTVLLFQTRSPYPRAAPELRIEARLAPDSAAVQATF